MSVGVVLDRAVKPNDASHKLGFPPQFYVLLPPIPQLRRGRNPEDYVTQARLLLPRRPRLTTKKRHRSREVERLVGADVRIGVVWRADARGRREGEFEGVEEVGDGDDGEEPGDESGEREGRRG